MKKVAITTFVFISLLALFYGSLKFVAPLIVKPEIEDFLSEQSGEKVVIQELAFSPFSLEGKVQDITLKDQTLLESFYVDVSLKEIFQKRITLKNVKVSGLNLEIIKKDKDYHLKYFSPNKPQKDEDPKEQNEGFFSDWGLVVDRVELSSIHVKLPQKHHLKIQRFQAKNLHSLRTQKEAQFQGGMTLEQSEIQLSGEAKNYHSTPSLTVDMDIRSFDLSLLNHLSFPHLEKVQGKLSTKTKIHIDGENIDLKSEATLENFHLFTQDQKSIEYFVKKLQIQGADFKKTSDALRGKISNLKTQNLILSIPVSEKPTNSELSKFAEMSISNVEVDYLLSPDPKKLQVTKSIKAQFHNEAPFRFEEKITKQGKKHKLTIGGMNLVPLSETFEYSLGYQISSGKLNLDYSTLSQQKSITGKAKVRLNQFKLDRESEIGRKIKNESLIPLDTAVSMVKSDEGSLEFEVDISGSSDNPNFGFMPTLRRGLGSLLVSELTTALATKAATQLLPMLVSSIPISPLNAFILVKGGYKLATKPRFRDIQFTPLEEKIQKGSLPLIKQLATFLKKNSKFRFKLCPKASIYEAKNSKDNGPSLTKNDALELAKRRIKRAKTRLQEKQAPSHQLIFCRPQVTSDLIPYGVIKISL